jgi:glycerol-3-phosphate acyltransferase PlsY
VIVAGTILVVAYLLGSLPWSLWIGRFRGVDLRTRGSRNLGATNAYRVLGWRWGAAVLLLDVAKGVAAVALARSLAPSAAAGALPSFAALAALTGHMWTPFAGFRGGKGVATGLGVLLGMAPTVAVVGLLLWIAVLAYCGWVSLASGMAAVSTPVTTLLVAGDLGPRFPWVLGLTVLIAVLVVARHRVNWRRIRDGEEQPIWERHREPDAGGDGA